MLQMFTRERLRLYARA